MRNYVIVTDSTGDLPEWYVNENSLKIIPICYSIKGEVYGEEQMLDEKEFYQMMREGEMPTTMAANQETVRAMFIELLEQGLDILYIAFSSGLSSSYNTSCLVARDLQEDYPEQKIYVIDSLCASLGEGLLVHKAAEKKKQGLDIDAVKAWVEDHKMDVCQLFTVDDLHHLHRGGRVSKATASVGTLINVKPILHVDEEGKLVNIDKVRGRKKSLGALVDKMAKATEGYADKNDIIFISHGDCQEDAEYVAELIKDRLGVEKSMVSILGPTIGTHTGPGLVALFFMGKER